MENRGVQGDAETFDNLTQLEQTTHTIQGPRLEENEPVGDIMMLPKPDNITRIYMINPDGITIGAHGTWSLNLDHLKDMEADIVMMPEIKLDTTQPGIVNSLHRSARRCLGFESYKLTTASSSIRYHSHNKPGGVLSMMIGSVAGRVCESEKDEMGRWVINRLRGAQGKTITIITTYQVVDKDPKTAGPATAVTQQYSMLMQRDPNNQPDKIRKHHCRDLLDKVKECQDRGEFVIVGGDFNEEIGFTNEGLSKLVTQCNLVDPFFSRHGISDFATHNPGSRVIDYVLIDSSLQEAVREVGYQPFSENIISNHRGLYLDLDTILFFGNGNPSVAKMEHRDLVSKRAHQIQPYFEKVVAHLEEHNWFERIAILRQCMNSGEPNHQLAESLDKIRIQACQCSAKRLKRYPPVPYSPDIARFRNIEHLLRLKRHSFTSRRNHEASILRRLEQLGEPNFHLPTTKEDCEKLLKATQKDLRRMEKEERNTAKRRRQHQQDLQASYWEADNAKAAKIVQRIQKAEEMARVWRKCAAARGLTNEGGLSYLLVPEDPAVNPKQCDAWRRIDDQEEINDRLQERNQKHFGQAKGGKLTAPPFDVTMDFEGTCAKADAILAGTFQPPEELDDTTEWLLDSLQYITEPNAIDWIITEEEFRGKVKVWNERTSTSPVTNVHLGHAKAYFARHSLRPDSDDAKQLETDREEVLKGHLTLLNYALQFGYSYDRWKSIVNAMLEKDPGQPKIHRLRVIHLYEYDFNLILGVKWRRLLKHCCTNNLLNDSCFGSRPGCTALDPVFTKVLELEISTLTNTALIQFDNDMTACYDRIPMFLANVLSRKYGMHFNVCCVQGKTFREAKYYLKTRLGVSQGFVSHSMEEPWYGIGQGAGNAPMNCLQLMSTLYDMYEKKATGATYVNPDGSITAVIKTQGFVDDTTNRNNSLLPEPGEEGPTNMEGLLHIAAQDCQAWHDILTAANQQLELTKCKYHAVYYDFDEETGEPTMVDNPTPPVPVTVVNTRGEVVEIEHVPVSKEIKNLGCQSCPQNKSAQLKQIRKGCRGMAKACINSPLVHREAHCMYQAIYKTSVGYPLPMCHFTYKELDKAQLPAHTAFLRKCGYNGNMTKDVVYGPRELGGINFDHLYDIQGLGQIQHLLKAWRCSRTHQGKLLQIAVQWAQVHSGVGWQILLEPNRSLPHLNIKEPKAKWIVSVREFLKSSQGAIELSSDTSGVPKLQRENDLYLMDHFLTLRLSAKTLKRINYCRLYLNVHTLSDITNATGTEIDDAFYEGDINLLTNRMAVSKWLKINQPRPGDRTWQEWQKACRSLCRRNQKKRILKVPLGHWIVPPEEARVPWKHWLDRENKVLYQATVNGDFSTHEQLAHDYEVPPAGFVADLPLGVVPVDVRHESPNTAGGTYRVNQPNRNMIREVSMQSLLYLPESEPIAVDEWEYQLLSNVGFIEDNGTVLMQLLIALETNDLVVCSDGSAPKGIGSFGWIASTRDDGCRMVTCHGPAPGAQVSSYRAEGYGLLSVTRFLLRLAEQHKTPHELWELTVYCDNESMVKKAKKRYPMGAIYPNFTLSSDFDIVVELWQTLEQLEGLQCQVHFHHIDGHQDREKRYQELSLPAQLNVQADYLAGDFQRRHPTWDYRRAPVLPSSKIQLHLHDGTVTHHLKQQLKKARYSQPLINRMCRRNGWNQATANSIDWDAHRIALGRQERHRTSLTKYLHGWLPVGHVVHRYDKKYEKECPSCNSVEEETIGHLHVCPGEPREQWRKETLAETKKKLCTLQTPFPIQEIFLNGLHSALYGTPPPTTRYPHLQGIIATQGAIGWDQLLKGRLSVCWRRNMAEHYRGSDSKGKDLQWSSAMAELMLSQWWKLWTLRNEARHGKDLESKNQAAKRQALREIQQLYELQDSRRIDLQWIYHTPLETIQSWSTSMMRAWINNYRPILLEGYNTALETG
jgi:hypothetical protein